MNYKMLPLTAESQQIYARIDDDGLCRVTCTGDNPEYLAWLAEGNTPEPAPEPEPAPVLTTEQKLEAAGLTVAELRELFGLPAPE
jgi:hypothetical protein